jgi:hypothetical protein
MTNWAQSHANSNEYQGVNIAAYIAVCLMWLSIIMLFCISPMVLFHWGSSYEKVGGSILEKIHPGGFVAMLALIFQFISYGSWRYVGKIFVNNWGVVVFIVATILLTLYAIFVQKISFTPILDTFSLPIIVFIFFNSSSQKIVSKYAKFLHVFFAINALLALYEYVTGNRLTPFVAGTIEIDDDWRSTALLGHPLGNALITGAYILLLVAKNGAGMALIPRILMLLLQFSAMIAFGARVSLVMTSLFVSFIIMKNMTTIFIGRTRFSLPFLAVIALCIPIIAAGVFALVEIGFFDRLIERFSDDKGSANARIAMFQLFNYIPFRDVLLGPDQNLVETLKGIEGVEAGIESIWVAFILTYGLVISIVFFIGLFAFCANVVRRTHTFTIYIFMYFFIVASTSVSLAAKTPAFGMLIIMLFVLQNKQKMTHNANTKC